MFSIQFPCSACGLLSKKQYAASAAIILMMKLLTDLCLECTSCAVFFSMSLIVSKYLVGITSEIVADRHHRRVHETDACTTTEGGEVKKEHHLEEHAALEFHESVVGYGIGEIVLQMLPDEEQVVVFESAERTKLEHY